MYTQVVSTLLEAGLWAQDKSRAYGEKALRIFEESRNIGGGLVGFGALALIFGNRGS